MLDAISAWMAANTGLMVFAPTKLAASRKAFEAMAAQPKVLVELGTYVGFSAVAWGAMLVDLNGGRRDGIKVWCCEMDPEFAAIAADFIALAGLQDVVEVVRGRSSDSLAAFAKDGRVKEGALDVLFLDHWEEAYMPDVKLCEELKLFHIGSLIVADNTDFPGAPEYLEFVKKGGDGKVKYETETVDTEAPVKWKAVEFTTVVSLE